MRRPKWKNLSVPVPLRRTKGSLNLISTFFFRFNAGRECVFEFPITFIWFLLVVKGHGYNFANEVSKYVTDSINQESEIKVYMIVSVYTNLKQYMSRMTNAAFF